MVRIYSSMRGAAFRAAMVVVVLLFLRTAVCAAAENSPLVEVTAPSGPARVGEGFPILVIVGWDGEGGDIKAGRPTFDVPESLTLEATYQESRTVLRDGVTSSTKEYGLIFKAKEEGSVEIGPFSLNAKRGDEEFGLTGKAVEIEVVRGVSKIWILGAIAALVVVILFFLLRRKRARSGVTNEGS